MKYFILEPDKTIEKKPIIKLSKNDLEDNKPIIIEEKETKDKTYSIIYPDYIENEYPIFSEQMKELIEDNNEINNKNNNESNNENLIWKPIILNTESKQLNYFMLKIIPIDCLSEETDRNHDLSIKKPIIHKEKINEEKILNIKTNTNQKIYIVRLDLAESILKREFIGIELKEILVL